MKYNNFGAGLMAACGFLIAVAAPSYAQSIDETLVMGRALEESIPLQLQEYGNRVEILSAEEIQLGGYNDVAQALQMEIPGLHVAPKNGAFDYFSCSLQGSRCQDILWLVDGVRINNRLYNTTTPLDTIPSHMVDHIEVLFGGQGIFYGTQSVAGVVNIVTKGFSAETQGNISMGLNSNDGITQALDLSSYFGDVSFTLYASHDDATGFSPYRAADFQPSATDRERGYDVTNTGVKLGYQLSDQTALLVHVQHTDATLEFARPNLNAMTENARQEDLVTLKLDHEINENLRLYAKAYSHNWDTLYTQIFNDLTPAGALAGTQSVVSPAEYWGYNDSGITAVGQWRPTSSLDVSVGFASQQFSGSDEVLLIADQEETVNAWFAQLATTENMFADTRIALGMRHNSPEGEGDISVWNLSALHNFGSSGYYARLNTGTSFRLPDAWQLYGNDPCCTLGNPNLEGEKSRNLNFAVGGNIWQDVQAELVWFDRRVENLIGSEPPGTPGRKRINLNSEVTFSGYQFTLTTPISDSIFISFDYTSTNAKAQGSNQQMEDIPEQLVKISLSNNNTESALDWSLSLVYTGALYDSSLFRDDIGGYTLVDLGLGYRFGASDEHRIGLRLENLTDEQYSTSLGNITPDVGGVAYQYGSLGTPRTTHLSYRYNF